MSVPISKTKEYWRIKTALYKSRNREKVLKYKREWARAKRKKIAADKTLLLTEDKKFNDKQWRCEKCEILMTSESAKGHDDTYCGKCLEKVIHQISPDISK